MLTSIEKNVRSWLKSQDTFTLHKAVRYSFPRLRVRVYSRDELWDVDLMDVSRVAKYNSGTRYILICIDVFSRYLWAIPIKDKKSETVLEAFKSVLSTSDRRPKKVRHDKGKEFISTVMKTFLKEEGIKQIVTQNAQTKANFAERVIKSLRSLLARYSTYKNSDEYLSVLSDLVHNYNHRKHKGLGGKYFPAQVDESNETKVWRDQYYDPMKKKLKKIGKFTRKPFLYNTDDLVRISYLRGTFARERDQKWSEEIFKVPTRQRRQRIPTYKLKDYNGEPITGTFYQAELQAVDKNADVLWKVEKIVGRKKLGNKKLVLVRWKGWPSSFDSYVAEKDLKTL